MLSRILSHSASTQRQGGTVGAVRGSRWGRSLAVRVAPELTMLPLLTRFDARTSGKHVRC